MIFTITMRGIIEHRSRFVMSLLAVIFGVTFVSGTMVLRGLMDESFSTIVSSSITGDAYLRVKCQGEDCEGGRPRIETAVADAARPVAGVREAFAGIRGPIALIGTDGIAVTQMQATPVGVAYYPGNPALKISDGAAPVGDGQIALDPGTIEDTGLTVGSQTSIVVAGQVFQVTVSGEVRAAGAEAGSIVVYLDEQTALRLYAPENLVESIAVYAEPGVDRDALVAELRAAAPSLSNVPVEVTAGDVMREESMESLRSSIGFVETFLWIFTAIALFVGTFIIGNTFSMTVAARGRELAVLRAVGGSPRQVFVSVVGQAIVVSVVGSAIGAVTGLFAIKVLQGSMSGSGLKLTGEPTLSPLVLATSLAAGMMSGLVASALPALSAARIPPISAIQSGDIRPDESRSRSMRWSIPLAAIGLAMAAYATSTESQSALPLLGIGAVAFMIPLLMLSERAIPLISRVVTAPFIRPLAPIGMLARGNAIRYPRRTANTAGALMIGVSLVCVSAVISASTSASLVAMVAQEIDADYVLTPSADGGIPEDALTQVEADPMVARLDRFSVSPLTVGGFEKRVATFPAEQYEASFSPTVLEGTFRAFGENDVALERSFAEELNVVIGSEISIEGERESQDLTVLAIYESQNFSAPAVIAPETMTFLGSKGRVFVSKALVTLNPNGTESRDDAETHLLGLLKPFLVVSLYSGEDYTGALAGQVNEVLAIVSMTMALSVMIALLCVVNTLTLSISERTREIGMLRAVGLGRMQLVATIVLEALVIAVLGTAIGTVIGTTLGAGLQALLQDTGMRTLAIPWAGIAVAGLVSIVVATLSALWPGILATRVRVLDAISRD